MITHEKCDFRRLILLYLSIYFRYFVSISVNSMLTDVFAAYLNYLVKQWDLAAESAEMTNIKNRIVRQAET